MFPPPDMPKMPKLEVSDLPENTVTKLDKAVKKELSKLHAAVMADRLMLMALLKTCGNSEALEDIFLSITANTENLVSDYAFDTKGNPESIQKELENLRGQTDFWLSLIRAVKK